uniref:(northern house mosquito) hypothetical protein n=1 Tax=Culex pipiens TaxID=7175 RepID=A0A8D8A021_CULPI
MYLLIPGSNQGQSTRKVITVRAASGRQRFGRYSNCEYRTRSWKMTPFTRYYLAMWWITPISFDDRTNIPNCRVCNRSRSLRTLLSHIKCTPPQKHTHTCESSPSRRTATQSVHPRSCRGRPPSLATVRSRR